MKILPQDLLTEIDTFLTERGMSAKAFGKLAVGDGSFISRLRAQANMQIRTIDKAYDFLKSQQRSDDAHAR